MHLLSMSLDFAENMHSACNCALGLQTNTPMQQQLQVSYNLDVGHILYWLSQDAKEHDVARLKMCKASKLLC